MASPTEFHKYCNACPLAQSGGATAFVVSYIRSYFNLNSLAAPTGSFVYYTKDNITCPCVSNLQMRSGVLKLTLKDRYMHIYADTIEKTI